MKNKYLVITITSTGKEHLKKSFPTLEEATEYTKELSRCFPRIPLPWEIEIREYKDIYFSKYTVHDWKEE